MHRRHRGIRFRSAAFGCLLARVTDARTRGWAALRVAPFVVLLAHACLHGDWIVDDAGISFAYARNLAEGHGLVAQVGASPVEGFTNLLWTVLLAAAVGCGVFDPVWTPKLLGVLAAAGAFALLRRAAVASDARRGPWVDGALALVACTPGFVAWSVSGLENGLLVLLVAAFPVGTFVAKGAVPDAERARQLGAR